MLGYAAVQRLLAWWWVLVPAVALFELARGWQIDADVPTSAEWASAAATVQRGFADGDLVVVAPEWAAQVARVHLEAHARDPSMRHFYFAADTRTGGPR
jgi:hypothetical protein